MKRALALALSVVLVLTLLPLAVSARSLTDGEKTIFEELRSPAKVADGNYKLPEVVITMAENWLMSTKTELTQDQINSILGFIQHAEQTVVDGGTGVVEKWPQAERDSILADIDGAAQVIGLRARGHGVGENAVGDEHGYGSIEIFDPATDKTVIAEDELVTTEYAPESDFKYKIVDGVAIITQYLGNSTEVIIPPTLGGKPVGGIDDNAFTNDNLTKVEIPETAKGNVSENAFAGIAGFNPAEDVSFYKPEESSNGAKTTGYNLTVIVLCAVGGIAVLGACVFAAKKAKLF